MTSPPLQILGDEDVPSGHVKACLNCGAPAPANYCPQCGQQTVRAPRSFAQYFQDSIACAITGRSRHWQTLSRLFFAPGALTVEYKAGRRSRYLRPLQVYLMASIMAFAAVQFFGVGLGLRFFGEQGLFLLRSTPPVMDDVQGQGRLMTAMLGILDYIDTPGVRRFQALSLEDKFTLLRARRMVYVSYVLLLMVPIFALALGLSYRDRRRHYAEHLVFGLHCQTFLLFIMLVESNLPALVANALSCWVVAYFTVALKRVYGGTWAETLGRGLIMLTSYFVIFVVVNLLLVVALLAL
jgi:hypothetical protein